LACAYLSESAQIDKLVMLLPERALRISRADEGEEFEASNAAQTEHVLTTRSRFTVGFIDVLVHRRERSRYRYTENTKEAQRRWSAWQDPYDRGLLIVEVKIGRVAAGELIRQLKLYAEHMTMPNHIPVKLVAALAYAPSAIERETIRHEGIALVSLADGFAKWREERREAAPPDVDL
jgi:hypothetical protein